MVDGLDYFKHVKDYTFFTLKYIFVPRTISNFSQENSIHIYIYLPIDRFIDRGALKKESWKREAQSARYSTSKDWALAARVYWLAVWFD